LLLVGVEEMAAPVRLIELVAAVAQVDLELAQEYLLRLASYTQFKSVLVGVEDLNQLLMAPILLYHHQD
jgi:hypothetical protein